MLLQMTLFHFLLLHIIPFCVLYIYIYYYIFIHLSVDGHPGCLHVLAIVTSAAMNIRVISDGLGLR